MAFPRLLGLAVILTASFAGQTFAREWTDEVFNTKVSAARPFLAVAGRDVSTAHGVIGSTRFYQLQKDDTFLDIARYYDLGYNEIVDANPGVDEWVPPLDQIILLPTEWVLPDVEYHGLVVNIPEMRLYYFHAGGEGTVVVNTFPVGLGRDDWRTPEGKFKVVEKTVNPVWILPASIKEEHRRDGKPAPDFIAGGAADNPLGKYRLRLTLPLYGIHGTDIPWGVGMQVSHGCVRLYPEDMERLFPMIPIGTPGQFVYEPVKVGAKDGHVYVEIHKDIYNLLPGPYREVMRLIDKFGWRSHIDIDRVKRAVVEQSGVPMDVTLLNEPDQLQDEVLRPQGSESRKPVSVGTGVESGPEVRPQ